MTHTENSETIIQVTAADDARRALLTFHKPGCAHLRSLEVLSTSGSSVQTLRAFQDEAKELGTPNPVAPCLRSVVGR